jgi:hypothetical protein
MGRCVVSNISLCNHPSDFRILKPLNNMPVSVNGDKRLYEGMKTQSLHNEERHNKVCVIFVKCLSLDCMTCLSHNQLTRLGNPAQSVVFLVLCGSSGSKQVLWQKAPTHRYMKTRSMVIIELVTFYATIHNLSPLKSFAQGLVWVLTA